MARARHFIHAVWSGHLLTITIAVANLITFPIALAVLGKPMFGLWNAVAQVAIFAGFLDLGIGPSLGRFIADFKDDRNDPAYGVFLKSVFAIGWIQGAALFALGLAVIPWLPGMMDVGAEYAEVFKTLLRWQFAVVALGFPFRAFIQLLIANHQMAKVNGCSVASTVANALVLVLGLKSGWGIYAYVVAAWSGWLVMYAGVIYYVGRSGLLPRMRGARISLKVLKPLGEYSLSVFWIVLGTQLSLLAPTLLITRHLGLVALADWTVGTRVVLLAWQLIARIPTASEPAFWEMFTRQEFPRLRQRSMELLQVSGAIAGLLGAGIVAANVTFVSLWTSGRVQWHVAVDVTFVFWVALMTVMVCLNMTPGITKRLGRMKYVYLLEGGALAALAYQPYVRLQAYWQVVLVLTVAVCLFRLPYGFVRTCTDLQIRGRELLKLVGRVCGVAVLLLVLAYSLRSAVAGLPLLLQFVSSAVAYALVAVPLIYLFGLPAEPKARLRAALLRLFERQRTGS